MIGRQEAAKWRRCFVAGDNQSPCDDPSFLLASTARLDSRRWFQQDKFQGNPHIVAQWADLHNAVAQAGDLRMLLIALNRSLNEPLTQCTRDGTPLFMALIFVKRLSLYSTPPGSGGQRLTLLQIVSQPIAPLGSGSLSIVIAKSGSILRRPILHGLTKSRPGFPRSNAMSSPAGSSVRSKTWQKKTYDPYPML
jgi:hypothetical protein